MKRIEFTPLELATIAALLPQAVEGVPPGTPHRKAVAAILAKIRGEEP